MNTGRDFYTADDLELLRSVSTATVSTQLFKRGIRGSSMIGVEALNLGGRRLVGPAFTLRYIPAREDLDVLEAFDDYDHPQRVAVETADIGAVLVMDCRRDNRAASIGSILVSRLLQRGVGGVVTDGAVRDVESIRAAGLPVYSAGASPMTNLSRHHAVDVQLPIGCGDVAVYPGDVIVGDADGVVCIPAHLVSSVARSGAEQEQLELFIQEQVEGGATLRGTYPPDQDTLGRYRAGQLPTTEQGRT